MTEKENGNLSEEMTSEEFWEATNNLDPSDVEKYYNDLDSLIAHAPVKLAGEYGILSLEDPKDREYILSGRLEDDKENWGKALGVPYSYKEKTVESETLFHSRIQNKLLYDAPARQEYYNSIAPPREVFMQLDSDVNYHPNAPVVGVEVDKGVWEHARLGGNYMFGSPEKIMDAFHNEIFSGEGGTKENPPFIGKDYAEKYNNGLFVLNAVSPNVSRKIFNALEESSPGLSSPEERIEKIQDLMRENNLDYEPGNIPGATYRAYSNGSNSNKVVMLTQRQETLFKAAGVLNDRDEVKSPYEENNAMPSTTRVYSGDERTLQDYEPVLNEIDKLSQNDFNTLSTLAAHAQNENGITSPVAIAILQKGVETKSLREENEKLRSSLNSNNQQKERSLARSEHHLSY